MVSDRNKSHCCCLFCCLYQTCNDMLNKLDVSSALVFHGPGKILVPMKVAKSTFSTFNVKVYVCIIYLVS